MKRIWIPILMLLLIPFGMGGGFLLFNRPAARDGVPPEARSAVVFRVQRGESLAAIAGRLEREGLIRSALFLRLISRWRGTEADFKSGYYRIPPGATTVDIHNQIVTGYPDPVRVTIPEGWTAGKIARRLEELEITPAREFLSALRSAELLDRYGLPADSLEGYLFPDTYFLPQDYPAEAVAQQMADNFFVKLKEIVPEPDDLDRGELQEKVILASIVEREYRVAEEAPLIASVFYNRLKYNIGLESCATLEYIITEIQGREHPDFITREDKLIDSAFNTYKWAGLPPGPISNPGRTALEAVFRPAKTEYYYFVLKDPATGRHYFSGDLSEHNEAKYMYLKK